MSRRRYNKPVLAYPQLLQQLKDRGLTIQNEDKALHLLKNISYYRLSGYWYPLLEDKENHQFKAGSTFETAFKLYCFDRELRLLVLREIEKIEVAVRSQMNHLLAHYKGVYWFIDLSIFRDHEKLNDSLDKLKTDFDRSDEQFIQTFREKYSDEFPPCWMMLEVTSFGTLSMMYENLKPGKTKRKIAEQFGLDRKTLTSWLHTVVYIRNVCAHHNRLWNRTLSIRPRIPRTPHNQWLSQNPGNEKAFFMLSMVIYFLNIVNPKHTFPAKFKKLLRKYPNVDVGAMGFPNDWEEEELWKCKPKNKRVSSKTKQ